MIVHPPVRTVALAAFALVAASVSTVSCGTGVRSEGHVQPDSTAAPPPTLASWLTPAARDTIEHGSLRLWYEAQRAIFPDLEVGEFDLVSESGLGADGIASTLGEQLGPIPERASLLVPSPGGRWLLDPYYGLELVERDSAFTDAWDVDEGFRIFAARTDSLAVYQVWGTVDHPWMGAWVDGDTFILAGSALSFQPLGQTPPYSPQSHAALWIGSMASRKLRSFRGPAIPDSLRAAYRDRRIAAMRARYPNVEWQL